MNILIVGGGGREHALGWKLSQSSKVKKVYCAPGNGGTAEVGENVNLDLTNHSEVALWVEQNNIDLVVIGSDEYLAQGLVDSLQEKTKVFGPTKAAAEIEWSKSFAKQLMQEEEIPTARFATFTKIEDARRYIEDESYPLVIKADGLALGKGVVIAKNYQEASRALTEIMEDQVHGTAGSTVVIEEFLVGREISIHAFCDGQTAVLCPSSQDHKRALDNDEGPNTGGMGTITPVPGVTEEVLQEIREKVVMPTLRALHKRNRTFTGVLYPGIILTTEGPKVIEFNARFGDPETQVYMRLLKTDLVDILLACIDGKLSDTEIEWSKDYACCIVLASGGYPGQYQVGVPIHGIHETNPETVIFQAATRLHDSQLLTSGGRVLGVTAIGDTLHDALEKAYEAVSVIHFEGMQFRQDIGKKSLPIAITSGK